MQHPASRSETQKPVVEASTKGPKNPNMPGDGNGGPAQQP